MYLFAALWLFGAVAAAQAQTGCTGKYARLTAYAGTHDTQKLLAEPAVAGRLKTLLGPVRSQLKRNIEVSGPIGLINCDLVIEGNAVHQGGEAGAIVDISIASGDVTVAILSRGRINIYVDHGKSATTPSYSSVPLAIKDWLAVIYTRLYFRSWPPTNARLLPAQGARPAATNNPATCTKINLSQALKIDFGKDAVMPTPAEDAAIRRAAAGDIAEFVHPEAGGYTVARADLNDDGRLDLLVGFSDIAFCGSLGCSGVVVMAIARGYAGHTIPLPNFAGVMYVFEGTHHGMHDLYLPNGKDSYFRLHWDGKT